MDGEERFEDHGVLRSGTMHGFRDGMFGLQQQSGSHVTELQVKVNDDDSHRRHCAEPDSQIGSYCRFPHPAFGRHDSDDPTPVLTGFRRGLHSAASAGRCQAGTLQQHSQLVDLDFRRHDVADAGMHGPENDIRVSYRDKQQADLRVLEVKDGGQFEGIVRIDSWTQDHHFRRRTCQLLEDIVGAPLQNLGGEGLQVTVQSS